MKEFFRLFKEAFAEWRDDKANRLAAAMAYYTMLSLAPLLVIAVSVAGFVFGDRAAEGEISDQISSLVGPSAADVIQTAIAQAGNTGAGIIATIIGVVALLFGASGVFAQLQDALNTVWEVQPKPGSGLKTTAKKRVTAMTMVLGIGFLLLVSLLVSAAVSALNNFMSDLLPGADFIWTIMNVAISFGVVTLLFAMIYKILPDVQIAWKDVWIGAAMTALLFTVGKELLSLYIGSSSVGSVYGAAGSLAILLVWVYYSGLILFFGAEFTQVYARRYGSRIVPDEDAVPMTERSRSRQGIPRQHQVETAARDQEQLAALLSKGSGSC
jgi:membrane protein